ncbi:MAG TPA: 50S ribosomal protein L22 [Candidatus Saccharimonadales bacterium]|nr:50S ribosomal protein L22 [Candidatus Saccharimonadales bacterium]
MAELQTIVRASAKGVRQSPRKIGLVAGLVRGRSVADALTILEFTPKRAAKPVTKLIAAAKANAVNNHGLVESTLQITQLQVTAGPRLKRFNPAAMGRALPYQKKSSHILVEVSGEIKPKKVSEKPAAKPAAAKKETK